MQNENIKKLFATYHKNYNVFIHWQELISDDVDEKEWEKRIDQRAKALHNAHIENQNMIDECLNPILNHWVDLQEEEYKCLYECLKDMYHRLYGDPFIIKSIAQYLIMHYEESDELDIKLHLYLFLGYANVEISRIVSQPYAKQSVTYYKKIIEHLPEIDQYQEEETRTLPFIAFNNLLRVETSLGNVEASEAYALYRQLKQCRTQEKYCQYDMSNPRIPVLVDTALHDFAGKGIQLASHLKADSECAKELVAMTLKQYKNFHLTKEELKEKSSNFVCRYYMDMASLEKITWDEAVAKMSAYYERIKDDRFDEPALDPIGHIMDPIEFMLTCLSKTMLDEDRKKQAAMYWRTEIVRFMRTFPIGISSYSLNSSLKSIIFNSEVMSYMGSADEKESFLFEVMISRQLTTCLHSIMVTIMAEYLIKEIIDHYPEMLLGCYHFESVDQIKTHRQEIVDFVHKAGLFHDIGKNSMIDIVNTEYRDLDDEEFAILRMHPNIGKEYLEIDEDFKQFCDIAQGHHRYYNGFEGYPMNFDPLKSLDKFIIELISICDSIDAATDAYGRNYQKAKKFDEVLKELQEDSGTRYNPSIVGLIAMPNIHKNLRIITEDKRAYIYLRVQKRIFNKQ